MLGLSVVGVGASAARSVPDKAKGRATISATVVFIAILGFVTVSNPRCPGRSSRA